MKFLNEHELKAVTGGKSLVDRYKSWIFSGLGKAIVIGRS